MILNMPFGATVLLASKENKNKFVAVQRRENPQLICLPGGKLQEAESIIQSAIREVREETGINLKEEDLSFIYEGECLGGDTDYFVVTFLVYITEDTAFNPEENDMHPFWTTKEDLLGRSMFKKYNQEVFTKFKMWSMHDED